jgi:hypothetical protein
VPVIHISRRIGEDAMPSNQLRPSTANNIVDLRPVDDSGNIPSHIATTAAAAAAGDGRALPASREQKKTPGVSQALLFSPLQVRVEQQPKVPPRVGLAGVRGISGAHHSLLIKSPDRAVVVPISTNNNKNERNGSSHLLPDSNSITVSSSNTCNHHRTAVAEPSPMKCGDAVQHVSPPPTPGECGVQEQEDCKLYSRSYTFPSLTAEGRQIELPSSAVPPGSTVIVWARQRQEDKTWGEWEKAAFKI